MGIADLDGQLAQRNLILVDKISLILLLPFFLFPLGGRKESSALTLVCKKCPGCSLLDLNVFALFCVSSAQRSPVR